MVAKDTNAKRAHPLSRDQLIPWVVTFSQMNIEELIRGRPGDLLNLLYELRRWLDLDPREPLAKEVDGLERNPANLQSIVDEVGALVGAVADRRRFEAGYAAGRVVLDATRLGQEGARALSYRDASLRDAIVRLALDDICEDAGTALRIRRCAEPECSKVFVAQRRNQRYCGHRCANKMATRVYRRTHRTDRAVRERERYQRKIAARLGKRVKVSRATRGTSG